MSAKPLTREGVYQELTRIFHRVFEDEGIALSDGTTASDIPQWDSLNHINIVVSAEKAFGVKFRTAEVTTFSNVGEFVDAILSKAKA